MYALTCRLHSSCMRTTTLQVATENSIRFYRALKAAKVSAELHIFRKGEHGFGLRFTKGLPVAVWPDLYVAWARNLQMIP